MNYILLDIRLGAVVSTRIENPRIDFHQYVIKKIFPGFDDYINLIEPSTIPFSYSEIHYKPGKIGNDVENCINKSSTNKNPLDLVIIDFTGSSIDLLRDPILINLAIKIEEICKKHENLLHMILIPDLLNDKAASMEYFKNIKESIKNNKIIFLSNSGKTFVISNQEYKFPLRAGKYQKLVNKLNQSPSENLKNKLIRRLGYFQPSQAGGKCRFYSYLIDNCDDELISLIESWWDENNLSCTTILLDSPNIESLLNAAKAFAVKRDIQCHRIRHILDNADLAIEVSKERECLIILDVIETGKTLLYYMEILKNKNISINKNILTSINKGGSARTQIGEYDIHGFIQVGQDPEEPIQIQKNIGLPFTPEDEEKFDKIRSFDMWYMSKEIGWEEEQEGPSDIGYFYDLIPKFQDMIVKYGDWFAYKMEKILKKTHHPENMFIIHPFEPSANALSDKLCLRFEKNLTVVKIHREHITQAQKKNNSWGEVLENLSNDIEWKKELKSIRNASALIIDVFNASGSTFKSIFKLLKYYNLNAFCYFPLVDRDCHPKSKAKYTIQKHSLYDWYGPRKLKE